MQKIVPIQYLRAVAAIAVVGAHTFWNFGAEGVDLFFVISGFIMFYIIDSRPEKSAKSFFLDRYLRIAPMYYIATLVFVLFGFAKITSLHQVIQVATFLKYYETSPLLSMVGLWSMSLFFIQFVYYFYFWHFQVTVLFRDFISNICCFV